MLESDAIFSAMGQRVQPSAIRQLVPYLKQPGIISFAGGWPAAELFPTADVGRISQQVMAEEGAAALQYGPTYGDPRLQTAILERLNRQFGVQAELDNITITTGAQQGIFLLAMILLNPGDLVAVESPTYVGALGVLRAFDAQFLEVPMDEFGMRTDLLEAELAAGKRIKLVYTIPDYQNPTGLTLTKERRMHLAVLAAAYNFIIIEDAPYSDLRYAGEPLPTIYTLDANGRTAYLGSFSKIFAPLRLGWLIAPPLLMQKATVAKQQIDLCTPALTQAIAYRFCSEGLLEPQIERTRQLYQQKRDAMLAALDAQMPAGVDWTAPDGGMFIWLTLPPSLNADELFTAAIERGVAYVIGSAFYPERPTTPRNSLRLNFVTPTLDQINTGVHRLADVFRAALQ